MAYQLLQGDCIEVLQTLPAASVHCVVTSPPYFGLRDYGTAQWEGGDPGCDHVKGTAASKTSTLKNDGRPNPGSNNYEHSIIVPFREVCGKCGARRIDSQIGLEPTPAEYVAKMVQVFREVRRVLRDDGTVWLNLGDSYAANRGYQVPDNKWGDVGNSLSFRVPDGLKPKDLIGIPWRVAFALQADGWYLRSDIIWHKPNPMPESVTDRPTKAHEYLFLLAKRERYFYDAQAIKEASIYPDDDRKARSTVNQKRMPTESIAGVRPGSATYATRNKRSVWTIATKPYSEAHFATYPVDLVEPCIKAGTSAHGCCDACGAPWVRVVERTDEIDQSAKSSRFDKGKTGVNGNGRVQEGDRYVKRPTGWSPSCTCAADVVPCTVLDTFSGAATTGVAAIGLGRHYIGIELNPDYLAMADRRLRNTQPALIAAD